MNEIATGSNTVPFNPCERTTLGSRSLVYEMASDVKTEAITWLWTNVIALGMLNLFSGNPDQCKSLMTVDIAARVSAGRNWLDGSRNHQGVRKVLMMFSEDSAKQVVVPRLIAAGANLQNVAIVKHVATEQDNEREFSIAADIALLKDFVAQHADTALIVIDPFSAYFGSDKKMNDDQEVRTVTKRLKDFAEETGVAIIDNSHLNKTVGISAIQKVIGSMAVAAVHRMGWAFASADNESDASEREMLPLKHNVTADGHGIRFKVKGVALRLDDGKESSLPKIEYVGTSKSVIDDKLGMSREQKTIQAACVRIIQEDLLDGEWHDAGNIIGRCRNETECSRETVTLASRQCGVEKRKAGKGWAWRIPTGDTLPF